MVSPSSERGKVWDGLKRLSASRVDLKEAVNETFPWGLIKHPDRPRDPRDDRGNTLIALSIVEQALEAALLRRFSRNGLEVRDQLFESEGAPLRDLASKTRLAYAMGIIGKETRSDLSCLRRIRNTFAHSRHVISFETPEIQAACQQLNLHKRWATMMPAEWSTDQCEIFLATVFQYCLFLFITDAEEQDAADKVGNWMLDLLRG